MLRMSLWALVLLLFPLMPVHGSNKSAPNKTLFEGYYKMTLNNQHVGYYIQRYELDPNKKHFISTYFLRTNEAGGNISESLKAISTEKLNPVSYQFTSLQAKESKTIDANVRKDNKGQDVLQIKLTENGKLRVYETKLSEGTFFSTFLIYLILQSESGIKAGANFSFLAVAEEDGRAHRGTVNIDKSMEKKLGVDSFKVFNTFKGSRFVNFIDGEGTSLVSIMPKMNLQAELVQSPKEATQGITFNEKSIALLFGNIPTGQTNSLAKRSTGAPAPSQKSEASKSLKAKGTDKEN